MIPPTMMTGARSARNAEAPARKIAPKEKVASGP
jgi:hypothetical protein